jgi:Protein of unknown function (DUF3800)
MLNAYLDDSGTDNGPHCFVAGYLASSERWIAFSRQWEELCSRYTDGRPMRMCLANRKKGGMYVPEDGVLEFARCIRRNVDAQIWSASPEYEIQMATSAIKESRSVDVLFNKYRLCFAGILKSAMSNLKLIESAELVSWFFDQQGGSKFQASMISAFNKIRELCDPDQKKIFYSMSFADDKYTPPLQAADFLAWHLRRRHADGDMVPDTEAFKIITGDELQSIKFVWFSHKLEDLMP